MEILTPTGFQKFDGVKRYWHKECIRFTFKSGKTLKTAFDHRFIIDNQEVFARDVVIGQLNITNIEVLNEPQYFYDPINVRNGSVFKHDDDLVSHNTFHGNGTTLISGDKLLGMRAEPPTYTQGAIKVYDKPNPDHNYMIFVDVAKGRGMDYSTFNIIDVTSRPFKQVCTFRDNMISPLLFPDVIYKYAKTYNNAYVIVESNDQGAVVCNGLYYELEYENLFVESAVKANSLGVMMNRKVKRIGCSNLKDLIEEDQLQIVDDETIIELSTFEANGSSFEATRGNHDDLVMNLVLFAWFVTNPFFSELTDINVKEMIHSENIKMLEDQMIPFGFIEDYNDEPVPGSPEEVVWDGTVGQGNIW